MKPDAWEGIDMVSRLFVQQDGTRLELYASMLVKKAEITTKLLI